MAVMADRCTDINFNVVDINKERIKKWNGPVEQLPIYEPGLDEVVREARGRNLFFSNDINASILESEMIFMAVNTPTKTEGEGMGMAADLSYIEACAKNIAKVAETNKIVVEKSTLPVRTAEKIREILFKNSRQNVNFEILSKVKHVSSSYLVLRNALLLGRSVDFFPRSLANTLSDSYAENVTNCRYTRSVKSCLLYTSDAADE